MRRAPRSCLAIAALAVLAHAAPASAQGAPDPAEPARIRAVYTTTRDPAVLLDLATSLRRQGRHAEAALVYEEWRADPRADPDRAAAVTGALADIDGYVGRLTVQFDDPQARVWLDGRELPGFRSGNALRVDPGDHQVSAARPGMPPIGAAVRIGAREARTVELRLGVYIPPGIPVAPPPAAPMPPMAPVVTVVTAPPTGAYVDGPRLAGTLFVVTGALGFAAGAAGGIAAISLEVQSKSHCLGGGKACDQAGVDLQHQSRASGTVCTIGLSGGAAFMITGAVLRAVSGHGTGALPPNVRVGGTGMEVVW